MTLRVLCLLTCAIMVLGSAQAQSVDGADAYLNAVRSKAGLPTLRAHPQLQAAAEYHARDMARRNYRAHRSPEGRNHGHRALAQGYRYCYLSENIAQGQGTLKEVVEDWLASRAHRRNLLSRRAVDFGLARVGDNYWVLVLGQTCRSNGPIIRFGI